MDWRHVKDLGRIEDGTLVSIRLYGSATVLSGYLYQGLPSHNPVPYSNMTWRLRLLQNLPGTDSIENSKPRLGDILIDSAAIATIETP